MLTTPWDGSEDAHAGAAVHLHGPTREEIALEDESHRLPDLFRPAEPAERNPGLQAGEGLFGKTFQESGLRDAGATPPTRIPWRASSSAQVRVQASRPDFEAE